MFIVIINIAVCVNSKILIKIQNISLILSLNENKTSRFKLREALNQYEDNINNNLYFIRHKTLLKTEMKIKKLPPYLKIKTKNIIYIDINIHIDIQRRT